MYVRDAASTTHMGTIALPSALFQTKDCTAATGSTSGAAGTIQHNSRAFKTVMSFTWTPDAAVKAGQNLVAEAVIVESLTNWYTVAPAPFAATAGGAAAAAVAPQAGAATTAVAAAVITSKPVVSVASKPTSVSMMSKPTLMSMSSKPTMMTMKSSSMRALATATLAQNPMLMGATPTFTLLAPTKTCMCFVVMNAATTMATRTMIAAPSLMSKPTLLTQPTMMTKPTAATMMGKPSTAPMVMVKASTSASAAMRPVATSTVAVKQTGAMAKRHDGKKGYQVPPKNMANANALAATPTAPVVAPIMAGVTSATAKIAPLMTAASSVKVMAATMATVKTMPALVTKPTMTVRVPTKTVKLKHPTECVCVTAVPMKVKPVVPTVKPTTPAVAPVKPTTPAVAPVKPTTPAVAPAMSTPAAAATPKAAAAMVYPGGW
ncbi:hypothetical protein HDU93_004258 [Gonapodya sp. JEL0774]|nr:hypothetical protein HDU93_004258 [Gonapodya sp. JEL0774]